MVLIHNNKILIMSDIITDGIVKQFPEKFEINSVKSASK